MTVSPTATVQPAAVPLAPGTAEHLLYDDHWTASATALTLTMHAPTKVAVGETVIVLALPYRLY